MQVYNSKAKPLEEFFREDGLLREFEISGGIPETLPRLLQELGPFSYLLAERRAQAARNQLAKQMSWVTTQTQRLVNGNTNSEAQTCVSPPAARQCTATSCSPETSAQR